MDRHFCFEALVLRSHPVGESHRGVIFLTREKGLLEALAYGAQSGKSSFRNLVAPIKKVLLKAYYDPTKDNWRVEDLECISSFEGLALDAERFFAATRWVEIILKTHGALEGSFDLMSEALEILCSISGKELKLIEVLFLWRLADLGGIRPDFSYCDSCGAPLSGSILSFIPDPPSALCSQCASRIPIKNYGSCYLTSQEVDFLLQSDVIELSQCTKIDIAQERLDILTSSLQTLWKAVIGQKLKTF